MRPSDRTATAAEVFALTVGVGQQLTRRSDKELAHLGVSTPQWLLLAVLARVFRGQPTRISDAAAAYGTSRQNVKQIATQLASRGYLELRPDPADRRATLLHLTPKVAQFDAPGERRRQGRFFNDLVRGMDDRDLHRLEEILRAWFARLDGEHTE